MPREIIIGPHVDYDGILTQDERKKILARLESAFNWLGASIPKEIKIEGIKYKLREEIQNLIMKDKLNSSESIKIKKLISILEDQEQFLRSVVRNDDITEEEAMELSDKICGILRAVHELRELTKRAPKAKAMDAKEELMHNIEDKKRWIKYVHKLK